MPTVREVTDPYAHFLRNPPRRKLGICEVCCTFCTGYARCYRCRHQTNFAYGVLPISYSSHMGQLHNALRQYKDATTPAVRARFQRDLGAILWRFLAQHEGCLARHCRIDDFNIVTPVPSSTAERDARHPLREVVGRVCGATRHRYERLLTPTSASVPPRAVDLARYSVNRTLRGQRVLLVDDTWTTGASAQSAAGALVSAGAAAVGIVVIGRHLHDDFQDHGQRLRELPRMFNWDTCALH